jgi:hypothetical protein
MLVAQLYAFGGEVAVLRNGFTVRFERREQSGNTTRLYTRNGFLDIPTTEIASFEPDDAPPDIDPAPPARSVPPAGQAVLTTTNASGLQTASQPTASPVAAGVGPFTVSPGSASMGAPIPATTNTAKVNMTREGLDELVREASNRHRLDPDFVNSVIKYESNFQTRAVSNKGAQGLMQLMPGTAAQLGVTNPFDPQANVEGGTTYLSQLLDQYDNDAVKALAAYNAGPHRVDQYHGVPPYVETRAYVARIVRDYNAKKRAQMKAQLAQSGPPAKTPQKTKKAPASTRPQQAGVPRVKKPA